MNVPQLRFKGFEGEWEEQKIKDIAPLQRGFDLVKEKIVPGKYPIGYSNGILGFHNEYKAKGPGVFTGRSGTIGNIHYTESNYWPHNTSLWVTDFKGNNEKFIYYFYKKIDLKRFNAGSTVPTLNRNDVHDLKRFIPMKEEQDKIAAFLTLIDRKIEKQDEKIEKLEQFKKGMMQKIFSQKLRFKDEDGGEFPEWEYKKLGQIADIIMGQSPKGENYSTDIQQTVLIQGNADMKNGKVIPRIYTSEITKACLPGDIIMSVRAPVGEIALTDIEACIGRGVCAIRGSGYVYHYLYYFNLIKAWNSLSQGSTFESVNGNDIKTLTIPVPSSKEQEKITYYLTRLERKVEKEKKKLMFLSKQKKGFMQKLFI